MIPRILVLNDNSEKGTRVSRQVSGVAAPWRSRAAGLARLRHRCSLRDFDPRLRRRAARCGACPLHRRRFVRGGHPPSRHPACAGQTFSAGVEFGGGDRTLRRQVDDDIPAARMPACRRPRHSPSKGWTRRTKIAARELDAGTAGAEAAVRGAGTRHQADRNASTTCRPTKRLNDVYYLQHYMQRAGPPFHDFRVFVCDGKVVAMMSRRDDDWITNVNRGAVPERFRSMTRTRSQKSPSQLLRRWARILPASISCRPPMGVCWCSRSTACRPGRACNRLSR